MAQIINITALKYPNIPHYAWQGELLEKNEDFALVLCRPGRKLNHYSKGKTFTVNNTSLEYFSFKAWYTAALEIEGGSVISYYCNVAKPSVLAGNQLSFIDLDLDLVKEYKKSWQVADEDEFEKNSIKFGYPAEMRNEALRSLAALKRRAEDKKFPFNDNILEDLHIY